MYEKASGNFPDDNENPLKFFYDGISINPLTNYALANFTNPDKGETLLKMTVKCIYRNHDGYCSGFEYKRDNDSFIKKREELISFYFYVPNEFLDEENKKIKKEIIDSESNIIESKITKRIFKDWRIKSNCEGSGCCNLFDTYKPVKIEYIEKMIIF